jgi:hypothetical protein
MGGVCSQRPVEPEILVDPKDKEAIDKITKIQATIRGNNERKKLRNDNPHEEGEKGHDAPENQRDSKPMERQNTENIHAPPSHIATLVSFIPDQSNPEIKATLDKLKPFEYEEDSPEDKNLPNLGPYQLENSSFYEVATDFFGFF